MQSMTDPKPLLDEPVRLWSGADDRTLAEANVMSSFDAEAADPINGPTTNLERWVLEELAWVIAVDHFSDSEWEGFKKDIERARAEDHANKET